ncbi:MAG: alpha/beta hydrolase [Nocardioidaceae bacterium]|nr:alpha/beta hydrolase [Nocardioidaceae bacterium]
MALHPQAAAAVALSADATPNVDLTLDQIDAQRTAARAEAAQEPREDVAEVRDVDAGGVVGRLYRPVGAGSGALLYAHGGGFVFGDRHTHDAQSRRLANRLGRAVLAVDYRRPPEASFPAAHDDVTSAGRWLAAHARELGLDPEDLAVLGDSAGASLALVAALRDPGLYAAAVLVYPFIDPRLRGASFETEGAHGFSRAEADWFWRTYAGDGDRHRELLTDPDFCPLDAPDLGTLPPTQVLVAEHDILRDEALLLAERIAGCGASVATMTYPGMIHGFWRHPAVFDAAETAYADTAAFLSSLDPQP